MADSKLADLTEDTAPLKDDWVYKVINAGTSGSDRKVKNARMGGWAVIAETVLGATATSVSFTSIPATYRSLKVVAQGRISRSAARDPVMIRFNNDSSAIYYDEQLIALNTSLSGAGAAAATSGNAGRFAAATAPASAIGLLELVVPNYAGTTFHKGWTSTSYDAQSTAAGGQDLVIIGGLWASTSAINRVDLLPSVGPDFEIGSTFTLYGLHGA